MIKINNYVVNFETFSNGEIRLNTKSILAPHNKMANIFFKWEDDSDFMKLMYLKKSRRVYLKRRIKYGR